MAAMSLFTKLKNDRKNYTEFEQLEQPSVYKPRPKPKAGTSECLSNPWFMGTI